MFISNGTTFKKNSKAKLIGLLRDVKGIEGEIDEVEWVSHNMPVGIGLFEGAKDGLMYRSVCLTEEFSYDNSIR